MALSRRSLAVVLAAALPLAWMSVPASAADDPVPVPRDIVVGDGPATVEPRLLKAKGEVQVVVGLSEPSLAESVPTDALVAGTLPSAAAQQATLDTVEAQQDAVVAEAEALGATEEARVDTSLNAVVLTVDASEIPELAQIDGVTSVRPVGRYTTYTPAEASGSLAQAATYLGVAALRPKYTGAGVKVAVLDSGIDFTHKNLGGPGTVAAYEECYAQNAVAPTGACAALFGPSAPKVKGGFDFVGETWPNGPEAPDPNPIDFEGHGTHVSDIITGRSADGSHLGLAPGADLYGVKVCSAVSSACSGVALLQGVDWALDPNGDGNLSDAMDLMNLSLGSDYGQDEDDLTAALENAAKAGVLVVASAGNGGDRPYKVGSPSIAKRVISVAQTTLPDDVTNVITVTAPDSVPGLTDNRITLTVLQPWGGSIPASPGLVGDLARPTGSRLGCAESDFGPANAGRIALVDRGTCAISIKASNAEAAGATGMILVNNVPGAPGSFSYGGGTITVPVLAVSQADGNALVAAAAGGTVSVKVDPADAISLTNTMVASSSRGPTVDGNLVKPDIGAPGAWLSAEVGTGSENTNFGGTSGAAPTVSGVAALLLQKFPKEQPRAIKTRLLNGADTGNRTPDAQGNLYSTPVSRIGAGEVRAFGSSGATFRLRNLQAGAGNLSLGFARVTGTTTITRTVRLENLARTAQRITLAATFRDPADRALGAVSVRGTGSFTVPGRGARNVQLTFTIQGKKLPDWALDDAGFLGGDGTALNAPEIDGNLVATSRSGEQAHLGWQVLPRRSADVDAPASVNLSRVNQKPLTLVNTSAVADGQVSVYSLLGTSPRLPDPDPGLPGSAGSNQAQIDLLAVGARADVQEGVLQIAITQNPERSTPLYPAEFDIYLDVTGDGDPDYIAFGTELGGFGASGQCAVYVQQAVPAAVATPYFYCDADFNSSSIVYTVPLAAVGLSEGESVDLAVYAFDNYFSGALTDRIEGMTFTVGAPRLAIAQGDELQVPKRRSTTVTATLTGSTAPSTEQGFLLLYDDSRRDAETVTVVR
jgi:subtilisin family serine protease